MFKVASKILAKKNRRDGFTLIELLVVIAIVGILSGIVYTGIGHQREKTRDARRKSDLIQIKLALEYYYEFYKYVPNTDTYAANTSRGTLSSTASTGEMCAGTTGTDWAGNITILETQNFTTNLPIDPINSTSNCYVYLSNDLETGQSRGACVWTTLESETNTDGNPRKVGVIVGKSCDAVACLTLHKVGDYPAGYKCNFLDEVLLGGVKPSGTSASGS